MCWRTTEFRLGKYCVFVVRKTHWSTYGTAEHAADVTADDAAYVVDSNRSANSTAKSPTNPATYFAPYKTAYWSTHSSTHVSAYDPPFAPHWTTNWSTV